MKCVSVAALVVTAIVAAANGQEWTYSGDKGPEHWQGACRDKSQSPVDLPRFPADTSAATGNNLHAEPPFRFKNYDRTPDKGFLKNTGYAVNYYITVDKPEAEEPRVEGGGLPGEFAFGQFHTHWGTRDGQGSEHTVSGVSYPMELHLVHYNTKYGADLGKAIAGGKGAQDTLAVLGIMFQLRNKDNENLEPILDAMTNLQKPKSKVFTKLFPLEDLLPKDTASFYRYNGSLTTPGCNEIVVWTVFKDPIPISGSQMAKFRDLASVNPVMRDNYRPVQPLNGRTVLNVRTSGGDDDASAATGLLPPNSPVIALALAALLAQLFN